MQTRRSFYECVMVNTLNCVYKVMWYSPNLISPHYNLISRFNYTKSLILSQFNRIYTDFQIHHYLEGQNTNSENHWKETKKSRTHIIRRRSMMMKICGKWDRTSIIYAKVTHSAIYFLADSEQLSSFTVHISITFDSFLALSLVRICIPYCFIMTNLTIVTAFQP